MTRVVVITMYRTSAKEKKIINIDVSKVPAKHLEWFIKGVKAAIEAYEDFDKIEVKTQEKI